MVQNPVTIVARLLLFLGLWTLLAGFEPASWIIGVPAVLLATWTHGRLTRASGPALKLGGLLVFIAYFLWQSVRGGVDVAWRILRPRMRIAPGLQTYRIRLSDPAARVLFLDCVSLLPGSLGADMREGVISVHAIDASLDLAPELEELETRIAAIFGLTLEASRHA